MKRRQQKIETIAESRGDGKTDEQTTIRVPSAWLRAHAPRHPRLGFRVAPPLFLTPRRPPISTLLKRIWHECECDDVTSHAAKLAYYFLFSLFPALLFLASLLAFLPAPDLMNNLLDYLARVLPPEAYSLLSRTANEVLNNQRPGLLSISLFATLWTSSSAMGAVLHALNIAYSVPESRPWWRQRLLAIVLTIGMTAFTIAALSLIFFGGHIGEQLARQFGYGLTFLAFWNFAQWPLAIIFVLFGLDLIYYFAPNLRLRWRWITPGAVFALVCWLLISWTLRFYLARFSNYDATYGSIGGVIVLLLWLYLTGLVILIGGEINGVLVRYVYGENPALRLEDRLEPDLIEG